MTKRTHQNVNDQTAFLSLRMLAVPAGTCTPSAPPPEHILVFIVVVAMLVCNPIRDGAGERGEERLQTNSGTRILPEVQNDDGSYVLLALLQQVWWQSRRPC